MKKSALFSAVLTLVLLPMPVLVFAQGVDAPVANTRAAKKAREAKQNAATNQAPIYPKATREIPKQSGAPALTKQLSALFALQEKNDSEDVVIAKADAIIADGRANPFDKSSAAYLAGAAWQNKESTDFSNAVKYYKLAIENNGLHNNTHYLAMLQVAQLLAADDKNAEALTYLDRFLTETQSEDPKALAIKTRILVGMDKPAEAAAAIEKQLAAKPNDKQTMLNLASVYQQGGQDAKAVEIFERMRKGGLLTESRDYDVAWRLLANINGREKDALAVLEEGLQKGILTPSYEVYSYQGSSYYADEKTDKAIEAWTKGAPMSKNGEMYLNLGKVLVDREKWADAKAAARSALDKGVKKTGDAWQVIGQVEEGLGNKAGAKAAYLEAAKYPETKKWAEAELRQPSGK